MAYEINKQGEIHIGGWEKGIATSPHAGIGDLKGLNITSFPKEVMVNYARVQQSQTSASGTITFNGTNVITHGGADVLNATVITISGSSDANIPNGDYWCRRQSATAFNLSTNITNFSTGVFVTAAGSTTASFVTVNMAQPNSYAFTSSSSYPNYDYFINDTTGRVWWSRPLVGGFGFAGWALLENSTSTATAIFIYHGYLFQCQTGTANALRYKPINNYGLVWVAFKNLNEDSGNSLNHFSLVSHKDVVYICDGSSIDTLTLGTAATFNPAGVAGTDYTWASQALLLPLNEKATTIAEIGGGAQTTFLIGCQSNVLYPWDGLSTSYGALIYLTENNVMSMLTVNNLVYIFCGYKGNIYITNGSSLTAVLTVPDYIANNTGTNQDPFFIWGGVMYLRGRIWFSIKAPNCGGIWSFVPTINYFIQQDSGASLRLEHQNSNGTYSGYATVLFPSQSLTSQQSLGVQYYSGWDNGSSVYGIDFSGTTAFTGGAIIETDLISTGTLLEKKTFSQIEYKLSSQLVAGESVAIAYRQSLTDAFVDMGLAVTESATALGGYFPITFEKGEYLQLRITLTSVAGSPSWCRLSEIIIR